jgi:hypothetical protein
MCPAAPDDAILMVTAIEVSEQGTKDREQATKDREQGIGNRE